MSQRVIVDISISADEYLAYYNGSAKYVVTNAIDGRVVRFPAGILQRVVEHHGVHGRFVIEFDAQGRFVSINRVS